MTLSDMRRIFTRNLGRLLTFCDVNNYPIAIDQVKRTQAEADANAANGSGIRHSLHLLGLAADVLLYANDGSYLTDSSAYKAMGDYWKSLDPLNRWGGDFISLKDGNHFSMEYNGLK